MVLPRERHWPVDHGLTFACGLAVIDCICAAGVESGLVTLKWPNDPLVDGRKISGILIKSSITSPQATSAGYVLIGIGINVLSHPKDIFFPATSLKDVGLAEIGVAFLRDQLTSAHLKRLQQWQAGGFGAIRPECGARLVGVGQRQQVATNRERTDVMERTNRGIDGDGSLMLEMPDGMIRLIHAGDILSPI